MIQKVKKKIKSKDKIMNTLCGIDEIDGEMYANLKNRKLPHNITISKWMWELCEQEIELRDTEHDTHIYDYNYFYYPTNKDERTNTPVIYFMKEWVEDVEEIN